jgi:5'-nucleotidase
MRILLTNDDGILAPGLLAMYNALAEDAEVDVVAPQTVFSGGSHSITIRHPLLWQRTSVADRFSAASVEGTPVDCIKLAVNVLLPEKPDLVISGINAGLNTGIHVIYSGTVAAAIEAAMMGIPAVAVSLQLYRDMDFDGAGRIAKRIIDQLRQQGLAPGRVFNINIPEIKPGRPRGVRVAPQSVRQVLDRLERRTDPAGREYCWLSGDFTNLDDDAETDRRALDEGYVCVTPLQFNLTDNHLLDAMRQWTWPALD